MTQRLYYDDAYLTAFEAEVLDVDPLEQGARLRLSATAFYPTSGGQMHDLGTLAGVDVVDVVEANGEIWHHLVAVPDCSVGDRVSGNVDAERRAHHRQQHTGQHVLSRVLEEDYGLDTESSRLGESGNTLDVAGTRLKMQDLDALEARCHEIFLRALPVSVHFVDEEQAARWEVRAKKSRSGRVRVIEVEGVDRCACGGTHVRNTAEIGALACSHLEKVRGGQRIHFLCGARAVEARRTSARRLHDLATSLTTGEDQLLEAIQNLKAEVKALQRGRQQVAEALVDARLPGWLEAAIDVEVDGTPLRWVHRDLDEVEALALGGALRRLVSKPGIVASVTAVSGERGQLVLARSAELDVDCRELLAFALAPWGGRGGGSADRAQGGFPAEDRTQLRERLASGFKRS